MKIIITGGTGFLGRHLVWRLASQGNELVFTGRNRHEAERIISATANASAVRFVDIEHGDSSAAAALAACASDAQAIIHCSGLASPWGSREAYHRANVASTEEVLAACRINHISRLVQISSPSVYFSYSDNIGIHEDTPLAPSVNEYARSKLKAERMILAASLPHSVILRPRAIFGPWDNTLLPRLLRLLQYGRIPLLRGGRALLDMSYVDNVVDAVLLSLEHPAGRSPNVFNISNGEPIAAADLFARLAASFDMPIDPVLRPYALADLLARVIEAGASLIPGWEPPVTRYSLAAIAFSQTLDLQRARSILGYQPRVSLQEGIERTARWWKGHAA
jgi:nucleoside-diphosphate-sugar epimerase